MVATVKREYASTLRAEQARATRRAIVDAATELFIHDGYGGTTVDAIAAAARVSRKTVFTSVGGKVECLKLGIDWALAGDDRDVALMSHGRVRELMLEVDARVLLRGYAALLCERASRVARLLQTLYDAVSVDPDLRALRDEIERQRLAGMTNLAEHLALRRALRRDVTVTEASHILWLFHGAYYPLVVQQGWSDQRLTEFLADTLVSSLIRPDYTPKPLPRSKRAAELGVEPSRGSV